jgi:hypothetical protein
MIFLHYLYVKASNVSRFDCFPRVNIAWPLWLGSLWYLPVSDFSVWWIQYLIAFIIFYLIVLAIYPPKFVKKNYDKWEKQYLSKTSLWFWLYFFSFIAPMLIKIFYWVNHPISQ